VFFLSTSGEGFGVPTIEAMSCEVPVVATDYTTTKELITDDGETGIAVPISTEIMGSWNVWRGCMDTDLGAEALNKLYVDKELGKAYGVAGREKVLRDYALDKVVDLWDELLMKELERRNQ